MHFSINNYTKNKKLIWSCTIYSVELVAQLSKQNVSLGVCDGFEFELI